MAKHRRPSPKRVVKKPSRPARTRFLVPASSPARQGNGNGAGRVDQPPNNGHTEAVHAYEQGVEALQQRDFRRAESLFVSVIERYPEEKELHERVRVYLNVCRRQAAPPDRTPRTPSERVYAATLAINAGAYDDGLAQLRQALDAEPENDHVHYMLGVVHALRQDFASSLAHLQRAVELNPENRFLALQDADLSGLRDADASFRMVIDGAFTRRERREGHRPRASH